MGAGRGARAHRGLEHLDERLDGAVLRDDPLVVVVPDRALRQRPRRLQPPAVTRMHHSLDPPRAHSRSAMLCATQHIQRQTWDWAKESLTLSSSTRWGIAPASATRCNAAGRAAATAKSEERAGENEAGAVG